jgi:hypothetical protein
MQLSQDMRELAGRGARMHVGRPFTHATSFSQRRHRQPARWIQAIFWNPPAVINYAFFICPHFLRMIFPYIPLSRIALKKTVPCGVRCVAIIMQLQTVSNCFLEPCLCCHHKRNIDLGNGFLNQFFWYLRIALWGEMGVPTITKGPVGNRGMRNTGTGEKPQERYKD